MDWQLPDIGKTITNIILSSILSAHSDSVTIGVSVNVKIGQSVNSVSFLIWSKYVG